MRHLTGYENNCNSDHAAMAMKEDKMAAKRYANFISDEFNY